MAFADFRLDAALERFGLILSGREDLFAGVEAAPIPPVLAAVLERWAPQALEVNTEKAGSELIIAPILVELRRSLGGSLGLFSGVELNVDPVRGLNGVCDFILSGSRKQFVLGAPLMTIVEARNDNPRSGLGQCIAAMVAAQIDNAQAETGANLVHGAVTTGSAWKFVKL